MLSRHPTRAAVAALPVLCGAVIAPSDLAPRGPHAVVDSWIAKIGRAKAFRLRTRLWGGTGRKRADAWDSTVARGGKSEELNRDIEIYCDGSKTESYYPQDNTFLIIRLGGKMRNGPLALGFAAFLPFGGSIGTGAGGMSPSSARWGHLGRTRVVVVDGGSPGRPLRIYFDPVKREPIAEFNGTFRARFDSIEIDPRVSPSEFEFVPPKGAKEIR